MRPDWVVLGTPWDAGKVAVFASRDLDHAELEPVRDSWSDYELGEPERLRPLRMTLTVGLRTFVIVVADTYAEAFQKLFVTWSPDAEPVAIDGGPAIAR